EQQFGAAIRTGFRRVCLGVELEGLQFRVREIVRVEQALFHAVPGIEESVASEREALRSVRSRLTIKYEHCPGGPPWPRCFLRWFFPAGCRVHAYRYRQVG